MFLFMTGNRGPGRYIAPGEGGGEGDPGSQEPPVVTDVNGDVTITGKIKPGSFGKIIVPLANIAAGRQYTFRAVANFSQLAQQGKLAMVGFGFKNGNDFHLTGLRGDGSTGTDEYIVHGTPPNGWNKMTGHTEINEGDAAAGTQHSAYYRLIVSEDGTTYTLQTDTDGTSYSTVVSNHAITPFSNVSSVLQFGVALWFNNADAGPYSITITQFVDEVAALAPFGAIVKMTSNLTAHDASLGTTFSYDEEVLDTSNFHDNVTNNSRITIPAAHAGKYVMVSGAVDISSFSAGATIEFNIKHYNSSDTLQNTYKNRCNAGNGSSGIETVTMGPILVSSGDYFTGTLLVTVDNSITVSANNSRLSLLVLNDYITHAVSVKKAADLTGQDVTAGAAVTFDTELFDTNGFHDTGSNTQFLTIPSGVDYVIGFAQLSLSSLGASTIVATSIIHEDSGGTDYRAYVTRHQSSLTTADGNICTGLISVVPGDRLFLNVSVVTDTSITIEEENTRLGLVTIPASGLIGAHVYKAADQTSVNATGSFLPLTFDSETFDTSSIHSTASNTDRLTVPAGVRYAIVSGSVGTTLTANDNFLRAYIRHYNSANALLRSYGQSTSVSTTLRNNNITCFTEVAEGDYFKLEILESSDTSITIRAAHTAFSIFCMA